MSLKFIIGVKKFGSFEEARNEAVKISFSLRDSELPQSLEQFEEARARYKKEREENWKITPLVKVGMIDLHEYYGDIFKTPLYAECYMYMTCSGNLFMWDNTHKQILLRFVTYNNVDKSSSYKTLKEQGYNVYVLAKEE